MQRVWRGAAVRLRARLEARGGLEGRPTRDAAAALPRDDTGAVVAPPTRRAPASERPARPRAFLLLVRAADVPRLQARMRARVRALSLKLRQSGGDHLAGDCAQAHVTSKTGGEYL